MGNYHNGINWWNEFFIFNWLIHPRTPLFSNWWHIAHIKQLKPYEYWGEGWAHPACTVFIQDTCVYSRITEFKKIPGIAPPGIF